MRVAIFDEIHRETIESYSSILSATIGAENVFVITNNQTYELVKNIVTKNYLSQNSFKTNQDISAITKFLEDNKIDLFLYHTITNQDYVFGLNLIKSIKAIGIKVVLTVHNLNGFFKPNYFNSKHPKYLIRNFKNIFYKKQILKKIDAVNVTCENQFSYLKSIYTSKPVLYIPTAFLDETKVFENNNLNSTTFNIGLIGTIEEKRRDYLSIVNSLKLLGHQLTSIKIYFIGSGNTSYTKNIIKAFENLSSEFGLQLWYSNEIDKFLPNNKMYELVKECDIILSPMQLKTFADYHTEIYGLTKTTGNFYDMIRFKKPGIFPSNICVPQVLSECVISYDKDEDLKNKISKLIGDKNILVHLKNKVEETTKKYTLKALAKRVKPQLDLALVSK